MQIEIPVCQNPIKKIGDALLDRIYTQQSGEIWGTTFCGGEGCYMSL